MLGLAYRRELKKRAELPKEIADVLESDGSGAYFPFEISLPTIRVFLYALTHEPIFIKEQIEYLDYLVSKNELLPYYSTRLEIKELFLCLKLLDPECLWIVLERLKSHHTKAIDELKDTVLHNDFDRFVAALDKYEINTEPITPISKLIFIQIRIDRLLDGFHKAYEDISVIDDEEITDELREYMLRVLYELGSIMEDLRTTQLSDNVGRNYLETVERLFLDDRRLTVSDLDDTLSEETIAKNHVKSIKNEYPEFVENDYSYGELLSYRYRQALLRYCFFVQDTPNLSTYAKVEIEKLLRAKYYESIWSEFDAFDNNAIEILVKGIEDFETKHGLLGEDEATNEPMVVAKEEHSQESGGESVPAGRWRLQKYLSRKVELDKKSKLPYCIGIREKYANAGNAGDAALTKFIQGIADRGYIDDDNITKNSFAYALTGRGGFRTEIIRVRWHHNDNDTREVPESIRVLLYISSNLFDSDKTQRKTYSQIFEVLDAGQNPCIKEGKDQSSAYYDSVSDSFKVFYKECFSSL